MQQQWGVQICANNLEFPIFRKFGEYNNLGFQVIENNQRTGSGWVVGFLGKELVEGWVVGLVHSVGSLTSWVL
jgi:hypothetical protein